MGVSVVDWLAEAEIKLKASGIKSYRSDARGLLKYVAELDDQQIIFGDIKLNADRATKLNYLLDRRSAGEPLAYILGFKDFFGHNFMVDNRVLIPRPETENLVEYILSLNLKQPRIIDVGTGSGIIGLSLALAIPESKIILADNQNSALEVVLKNKNKFIDQLKISGSSVEIIKSNLLNNITEQKFNIIVANLPYVDRTWAWINIHDLSFEPSSALFADDSGLSLIKRLITQSAAYMRSYSYLILEVDPSQRQAIEQFAKTHNFNICNTEPYGDYLLALKLND